MMNTSLKEKYNLGGDTQNSANELDLDTRPSEYVAFRTDPQIKPSNAMIDFWMRDGDQRAIEYNHLYDVAYKRSEGLTLTFSEHQVTIHGRCLDELYRALKRHRVIFVWEASKQEATLAREGDPVVTDIHIQLRRELPETS